MARVHVADERGCMAAESLRTLVDSVHVREVLSLHVLACDARAPGGRELVEALDTTLGEARRGSGGGAIASMPILLALVRHRSCQCWRWRRCGWWWVGEARFRAVQRLVLKLRLHSAKASGAFGSFSSMGCL